MPNEVATKQTPVEIYLGEVLPENHPVLRALPPGVAPERFRNSLSIAVMMNPNLLKVHPSLTFREVARAANLGLSLDPLLGEGYLVIRRNQRTNRDEVGLQVGYRGLIRLARQSGEISGVYAHAVHENDRFEVRHGADETFIHEPDVFSEHRGPIIGFYAVIRFLDGSYDFEPMTLAEVDKVRSRSDGWRAFVAKKIKSTPWAEWPEEMAKKTVLRRILKRAPMSANVVQALAEDDRVDLIEEEKPARGRPRLPPKPPEVSKAKPEPDLIRETNEANGAEETEEDRVPDGASDDVPASDPDEFPFDREQRERRERSSTVRGGEGR